MFQTVNLNFLFYIIWNLLDRRKILSDQTMFLCSLKGKNGSSIGNLSNLFAIFASLRNRFRR